jgi:hypothetical protein
MNTDLTLIPIEVIHTNYGTKYIQMKPMGENLVPVGCYYDPGERYHVLIQRIRDSIFVGIAVLQNAMSEFFDISVEDINYEISYRRKKYVNLTMYDLFVCIRDYVDNNDAEDYDLQIIVNCIEEISTKNIHLWGTLIDSRCWVEDYYCKKDDENYPVWHYSLGNIFTNLDTPFSIPEYDKLRNKVIQDLVDDYRGQ